MQERIEKAALKISKPIRVQIRVGGKNDFMDIDTIYFAAPTADDRLLTTSLKKRFKEALFAISVAARKEGVSGKAPIDPDKTLNKDEILDLVMFAKDFDIEAFLQKFCTLFERVAFKDEEMTQRIIPSELDKIEGDDLEDLVGGYIENFFIGSWMKEKK